MARASQNGLFLTLIGSAIAIVAIMQTVNGFYTMDEMCKLVKEKSYIGNPTDCNGFGYCVNRKCLNGTCPKGTYWDMRSGICVYNSDYKCATTVAEVCAKNPTASYVADPLNCKRYCRCSATTFNEKTDCLECTGTYLYDAQQNICNWPTAVKCTANSICRIIPDGVFVGDPENCGQYFVCMNGATLYPESRKCENGVFDPAVGACVQGYNPCTAVAPSGPTSLPPNKPAKGECLQKTKDEYVSDMQTCYGFYQCDGSGSGIWGACNFATHFNPTTQKCVSPNQYTCPYDRCGNLNITYMANPGCRTFKYCKGSGFADLKCTDVSASDPYFNEATGNCQADLPSVPICTGTA